MTVNRLAWKSVVIALFTLFLANGLALAGQRAVPRGGGGDGGGSSAPPAGARPSGGAAEPRSAPSGGDSRPSQPSTRSSSSNDESSNGSSSSSDPVSYGRPRGGNQVNGNAVPRTGPPPISGGGSWGGGYYPSYPYYPYHYPYYYPYYPWGYGGFGFGLYYYGGYDPWYGYGFGYPGGYPVSYSDDGGLRLKVKPSNASVFVDGYYAGRVDDFDNPFQRLHLEPGPHRIEVRGDGLETLSFDVKILPGRDVTYSGELKRD